ncbi:MAG: HAMP domain-containing histidine kinase [Sandaracinus sp.]|nr:HAMP domain-containing histidine kinase [Sandaracinus sp.]
MPTWRQRVIYFVLLPAIAVAAGILGYYAFVTASRFNRLGEQTIAESTLLLVREKVETVEQYVIRQDNAALGVVEPADPNSVVTKWLPNAPLLTPSIFAIRVLDAEGRTLGEAFRGTPGGEVELRRVFEEQLLEPMELERLAIDRLKHFHRNTEDRSDLLSVVAREVDGERRYVVLHHDTGLIVRDILPTLFATDEGKRQYNVVDDNNRRVYGSSLQNAGDYLVGHRFPSTLYNWRLQVAPKQAPLLERQGRSRRVTDLSLMGVAFLVILVGVAFLLYAAQKERRLNDLKSEFIANVSHELKTPLSVVRMFGEMLLSDRVRSDDKRKQYLEIIVRESERLSSLIENVLDFSALERGRQRYELREGDLAEVVAHALETFRYRVEREGVEVELEVLGTLPKVLLDEQAIVLAVINLLDNAVKYGGRTPITITLERVRDFVQVRVRDRGPGVPADAERQIFDRFYRSRRDAHVRGSGIGLALVKHIALAHGGRAWATNAPDGGAVVAFAVPVPTEAERAREAGRARRRVPTLP